jgi:alcohol dehydrogenase
MSPCMVLREPGHLAPAEYPVPQLGPDDGLLEIEMAGVCHTDLELFRGSTPAAWPIIPGHELVGRIATVGERAAARWDVKTGDRVAVESIVRCGFCPECIRGRYKHCRDIKVYGTYTSCAQPPHLWGAFSQYTYLAPGAVVHKIPDTLSPELATLLCVAVANGLGWTVTYGGAGIGDIVVVQGVGPIGLSAIAASREAGAAMVVATGRSHDVGRLALALQFGADATVDVDQENARAALLEATGGELADVVLDTTGSPTAIVTSTTLVRPTGTVVNAGLTGWDTSTALQLDTLMRPEIRLQHVFSYDYDAVRRAMSVIGSGRYPFEKLITHRFPISEAAEAIRVVSRENGDPSAIKVVLIPDRGSRS